MIDQKRTRKLNNKPYGDGPVVYWMSRDQRVEDNWALIYAQTIALERKKPLIVVFCLAKKFLNATKRHYAFLLEGLREVDEGLEEKNIGFKLLRGDPAREILAFVHTVGASLLVTDFDPLKIKVKWKEKIRKALEISFVEVDAHNIVPCWMASSKQEYAAYTIRPKIQSVLPLFLTPFPELEKHPFSISIERTGWDGVYEEKLGKNRAFRHYPFAPGEAEAKKALTAFLNTRLNDYPLRRNDPTVAGQSNLSPYLHFGQLSAQRVALETVWTDANDDAKEDFMEELIIRRELSDNFCLFNRNYNSVESFPEWAKKSLQEHADDPRHPTYTLAKFENAETHDPLWNAAQMEMVITGKMHGYMRMYWAKKILEWCASVEEALDYAIALNDKYSLDGRDPNGYTGIAWSIGGVHDRAWSNRSIFGKIRYMSYNGCKSKFNVDAYIAGINAL